VKRPTRSLRSERIDLVMPTQEDFQLDLTARVREAVQTTIQVVLDEELERLTGAGHYQRSEERVDLRNGSLSGSALFDGVVGAVIEGVSRSRSRALLGTAGLGIGNQRARA
jgi:hypothetical protein